MNVQCSASDFTSLPGRKAKENYRLWVTKARQRVEACRKGEEALDAHQYQQDDGEKGRIAITELLYVGKR